MRHRTSIIIPMNNRLRNEAEALLARFFGYKSFRPGQYEVIEAVASGRDAVVIMPTGGGKSMCYQIPALLAHNGCAVVVSPLIALMQNQTDALMANGIPAAAVHSNQDEAVNIAIFDAAFKGKIKLLYISPERLLSEIDRFNAIPVSLFAIDEAHCISQWGHDFRPDYTALSIIKRSFPKTPVIALTATADRLTRQDIAQMLGLSNPFCLTGSFDRPNISLKVLNNPGKKDRMRYIADMAARYPQDSGIVYCLSRKNAESTTEALKLMGLDVACYHAGMSAVDREKALKDFLNGSIRIICATVAFGMGIDKSNIRWVIHCNIPGNIESYYQEIGRAGRDGLPAQAVMFYSYGDIITRHSFVEQSALQAINMQKLKQMQDYAEASVCRRRILLSYFGQEMTHNCGNCDNCREPRRRFDGTIIAQKALSAIMRTKEQIGINTLTGILKGANRADIRLAGYDRLPTFGCGADLATAQWNDYITQLIQLGAIEIMYERGGKLSATPFGLRLLRGLDKIDLTESMPRKSAKEAARESRKKIKEERDPETSLFEQLKATRQKIAREENLPAYIIFSDATLLEMAQKKPVDIESLLDVSGVGETKSIRFGKQFLSTIRKFCGLAATVKGTSMRETLTLFNAGYTTEQIAEAKNLKLFTVMGHLAKLIEEGLVNDYHRIITADTYRIITAALAAANQEITLELRQQFPSGEIGIVLAINRAIAANRAANG